MLNSKVSAGWSAVPVPAVSVVSTESSPTTEFAQFLRLSLLPKPPFLILLNRYGCKI